MARPENRRRWRTGDLPILIILLLLLPVVLSVRCRRPPRPTRSPIVITPQALRNVVVVIDPGHGGADPGAIKGGVSEAALTYRMATTLTSALHKAGATVRFTVHSRTLGYAPQEGKPEPPLERPSDALFAIDGKKVGLRRGESPEDLYRRAQLAARVWKQRPPKTAVYFLSLHYDALSASKWRGGLVCYDKRRACPPLAALLAQRFGEAKLSLHRRAEPKPRELGVLNPAHNPIPESVLVELATMSNPQDRAAAQSPQWRWQVARLLTTALIERERAAPQP